MEETTRISVRRGQHLVPLLTDVAHEARGAQPWKGVLVESHLVTSGEIPEHDHPDLCLHLQSSGNDDFEWWSDGRNAVEHTHPGSLIVIPPGTRDRLQWRGNSRRTILSIAPGSLLSLAQDFERVKAPEFRVNWSLDDPALRHHIAEMAKEAHHRWPLGSLYSDLLALGLKKHLLRAYAVDPVAFPAISGGMSLSALRRAMEYMNANLAEDLSLELMAKEAGVSTSHFAHEFRNSTGQTPYQYFLDQRMAKARELLKVTQWTVQYISGVVGLARRSTLCEPSANAWERLPTRGGRTASATRGQGLPA